MPNVYDLVGTLANVSYPSETISSIIYKPRGPFRILSAQDSGSHAHLIKQIRETFPNCTAITFVRTGTDQAEGLRKAAALKRMNADTYTDNNRAILKVISIQAPSVTLYHMRSNGTKVRFNG